MKKEEQRTIVKPRDIYEAFVLELQQWSRSGKAPRQADQDLAWVLENQHARLRSRNLELEYDLVPRGHFVDGNGVRKEWQDGHYRTHMDCRTFRFTRTMTRRGKKVFKWQKNSLLYQYITNVHDSYAAGKDIHICPNCGASSTLAGLMDGCDYCGTRFEMTDLYPKVGNFYHIEDIGMTKDELKGDIKKPILKTACLCIPLSVALSVFGGNGSFLGCLISGLLSGAILSAFIGYIAWCARKLVTVFSQAGKAIPLLIRLGDSEKRFERQMQVHSPEFSYTYFMDKIVNLLKTVLFSQDPQTMPFYEGDGNPYFQRIVDSQFTGATSLVNFRVVNGICFVTVDVCLDNLYDSGRNIREQRDWFRMWMCRDISKPIDLHFSIHSINCSSCATSFDAVRHKTCPSCGRPYQLQDMDWIVKNIRKL